MNVKVSHTPFPSGTITPVSSKSLSNRALMIDALTGFRCSIGHLSESGDTQLLQQLLGQYRQAGAYVELNAGMAGTVMRFMTTFCCLGEKEVLLTGHERMLQRPMKELVDALRQAGASIRYAGNEGYAPLHIKPSVMKGGRLSINAGISSQFISSLMLCAPYFENGLELALSGTAVSFPYINMTLRVMQHFGATAGISGQTVFVGKTAYVPTRYTVEGDWSSAAYFYSLAALSPRAEIELNGMDLQSVQADRAVVAMAQKLGVRTFQRENGIFISREQVNIPGETDDDFIDCPDLAQTAAVMYAGSRIPRVTLRGLTTLAGKETDRIRALESELKRFGVSFDCVSNDVLSYDASRFGPGAMPVGTWNDHRMAMSFAPLAQKNGTVVIEDAQVVQKSYPAFWEDLKRLGCLVENADI